MGARRSLVCLQTLLFLVVACARPPEDAESLYRLTVRARGLLENGDPGSAARLLERVAKAKPRADAYVNLGLLHQARGDRRSAVRALRTALELDPHSVRALFHLASAQRERARRDLQEAQAKPNQTEKLRTRAAERLAEAQALLERAAAADAYNAAIPRHLAQLHFERGDSTAARAALREAQRLDPGRDGVDANAYGLSRIALPPLHGAVRISRTPPRFFAQPTKMRATFVEVADVDGDAIENLVLGGSGALVRLESRKVDASPVAAETPWLERNVLAMQIGLFDDDRHPDLVLFTAASARLKRRGARLQMWFARGATPDVEIESLAALKYDVNDSEALDVDADGDLDLVLAVSQAPGLRLWRNDGRGGFEADAEMNGFAGLAPARAVTSGDLDFDGRADLVWIDTQYQLGVLGAREAGFVDSSLPAALSGQRGRAVACNDVDADGDLDILLGDDEGLWLWANRGAGRFERRAAYRETNSAWFAKSPRGVAVSALYLADLDNDGFQDAITLHFPEPPAEFATAVEKNGGDEDTAPTSRRIAPLLEVPPVSRLALWRNEGRGVFADLAEASGVNGMGLLSTPPRAIDLDRDGDLDLACVGPDSLVRLLWNIDAPKHRRLEIELIHEQRPSSCQGARVEIYGDTGARHAVLRGSVARIGVGNLVGADVLRVVWPDGRVENYFDVTFPESYRLQVTRGARGS
jgi:tetratricopeptide (TPR) repeat protein